MDWIRILQGRRLGIFQPPDQSTKVKGLGEVLRMLAVDLQLERENESETVRGLIELLWGSGFAEHRVRKKRDGYERTALWELVLMGDDIKYRI